MKEQVKQLVSKKKDTLLQKNNFTLSKKKGLAFASPFFLIRFIYMKKKYKFLIGVALVITITVVLVPEKHFKKSRKETLEYVSKEYDIHPLLSKFVVNTKLGRKIAYVFTKKTIKDSLKQKEEK